MNPQPGAKPAASPWFAAVTIGLAAAFLLGGYEFVRSTSNTLFKQSYGKQNLPVVMALMPVGLVAALYGYGRLLSWLGPRRTLLATSLFSALGLTGCYAAYSTGWQPATGVLYILREVYVVLLIEQYWSFLNSTLGADAAKKLNGPICGLGSLGAILGATALEHGTMEFGVAPMILFGAVLIVPAALCSEWAYRRCGEPVRTEHERHSEHGHLALPLFRAHPALLLLLGVVFSTQVVSTMLDLSFQGLLQDEIPDAVEQNVFSARFFFWLNAAAALSQFVLTPLLLHVASLGALHVAIPLVHITTGIFCAQDPSLITAGAAYLIFKTLDYSLFRAAKEMFYIPFSFDVRYRAKEIVDAFGYRAGKGGTSLAVILLQGAKVSISASLYAMIAAGTAGVWLALVVSAMLGVQKSDVESQKSTTQAGGL